MARVIKAGAGQKPARPATRVIVDAGAKKVIEREVYQAKQDAEHILKRAEEERHRLLAEGKRLAAQAREEAMARGASEAFAQAAAEALIAFRKRAERYAEAADDIRALALEVVKKVLGNDPDLGPKDVDKIMQRGMAQLRARRRLRLQVSHARLGELASERPNLMKVLQSEPDLVVEGVDDVNLGFARVVTEIGGALCAEENALDALSQAVNVREQPRGRGGTGIVNTAVRDRPTGLDLSDDHEGTDSVPDAAVIEGDDEADATLNLQKRRRPSTRRTDDVEEIEADEESEELYSDEDAPEIAADEDELIDENTGRVTRPRVRTGQVQVGTPDARRSAPTRVMPIDVSSRDVRGAPRSAAEDDQDATLRQQTIPAKRLRDDESSEEDADLDLFTDDAVMPGKNGKKR